MIWLWIYVVGALVAFPAAVLFQSRDRTERGFEPEDLTVIAAHAVTASIAWPVFVLLLSLAALVRLIIKLDRTKSKE